MGQNRRMDEAPAYRLDSEDSSISTRVSPSGTAAHSTVDLRFVAGALDGTGTGWVDVAVLALSVGGSAPPPPNVVVRLALHQRPDGTLGLDLPIGDRSITLRTEPRATAEEDGGPFTASGKVLLDPAAVGIPTPAFLNTMVHITWRTVWVPARR